MAEVVALVASIATLAELGFAISKTISTAAEENGSAKRQIKVIFVDMNAVCMILSDLQKRIKRADPPVTPQFSEVATQVVAVCKSDIDDISKHLVPLLTTPSQGLGMKKKLKWLFPRSKLSLRQASLNRLKLSLTLILQTLDYQFEDNVEFASSTRSDSTHID